MTASLFKPAVSPITTANYVRSRKTTMLDRFWGQVVVDGACLRWVGCINTKSGYGYICTGGKKRDLAHRWSYQNFIGAIPEGLHIDHLCRNRWCCKPTHLEPVTQAENNRRSWAARKAAR